MKQAASIFIFIVGLLVMLIDNKEHNIMGIPQWIGLGIMGIACIIQIIPEKKKTNRNGL